MQSELIASEGKNTLSFLLLKFNKAEKVWKEMEKLKTMVEDIATETQEFRVTKKQFCLEEDLKFLEANVLSEVDAQTHL